MKKAFNVSTIVELSKKNLVMAVSVFMMFFVAMQNGNAQLSYVSLGGVEEGVSTEKALFDVNFDAITNQDSNRAIERARTHSNSIDINSEDISDIGHRYFGVEFSKFVSSGLDINSSLVAAYEKTELRMKDFMNPVPVKPILDFYVNLLK